MNPLTTFPDEYQGPGVEEVLTELVYRLDLGIGQDLEADVLYAKCAEPLPDFAKVFLRALPTDTLVDFIDKNVPEGWPIRSIAGEQAVGVLHERLKQSA